MITAPETSRRRSGSPNVELADDLVSLQDDWARLADAGRNLFGTWEWSELWWRHYGGERPLRIAVTRDDDGDRLGPICAQNDVPTATRAMRLALAAEPHDVFVGDWVAGDREWTRVLGGRVVRTTGYPILDLQGDSWPEFFARQSTKFRKSVRFGRNRLERHAAVEYRYAAPATLESDLDAAFRLHGARFGAHTGCLFCGEHEAFQREFAAIALEHGWLRLLLLEIDGRAVGLEYGFFFQDTYFAYQGGRDPAWDRESVGFLLEVESIRRTFEEGGTEYRFLGGDEDYKYRYPAEDPRLETVVVPRSRRGRAASAALNAAWRLPGATSLLRRVAAARAGRSASAR